MNTAEQALLAHKLLQQPAIYKDTISTIQYNLNSFVDGDLDPHYQRACTKIPVYRDSIKSDLDTTEFRQGSLRHECESLQNWVTVVGIQKGTFNVGEEEDQAEVQTVSDSLLSIQTNAIRVRAIEKMFIDFLRTAVDTKESASSIHLINLFASAHRDKARREKVLSQVSSSLDSATSKLRRTMEEKTVLEEEQEHLNFLMKSFRREEVDTVAQAQNLQTACEEWEKRKTQLLNELDDIDDELEIYRHASVAEQRLQRESKQSEIAILEYENNAKDRIRQLENEMVQSNKTIDEAIENLQKELKQKRQASLQAEKSDSANLLKKIKAAYDKEMPKYKKKKQEANKTLEKAVKKSTDPEKSIVLLQQEHEKSMEQTEAMFKKEITDLEESLSTQRHLHSVEFSQNYGDFEREHKKQMNQLQSRKDRVIQEIADLSIEVSAVDEQAAKLDGVVDEFTTQYALMLTSNNDLEANLSCKETQMGQQMEQAKLNIQRIQQFIMKAARICDHLKQLLSHKKVRQMPLHNSTLTRSNSFSGSHSQQITFTPQKKKEEIQKERSKSREEKRTPLRFKRKWGTGSGTDDEEAEPYKPHQFSRKFKPQNLAELSENIERSFAPEKGEEVNPLKKEEEVAEIDDEDRKSSSSKRSSRKSVKVQKRRLNPETGEYEQYSDVIYEEEEENSAADNDDLEEEDVYDEETHTWSRKSSAKSSKRSLPRPESHHSIHSHHTSSIESSHGEKEYEYEEELDEQRNVISTSRKSSRKSVRGQESDTLKDFEDEEDIKSARSSRKSVSRKSTHRSSTTGEYEYYDYEEYEEKWVDENGEVHISAKSSKRSLPSSGTKSQPELSSHHSLASSHSNRSHHSQRDPETGEYEYYEAEEDEEGKLQEVTLNITLESDHQKEIGPVVESDNDEEEEGGPPSSLLNIADHFSSGHDDELGIDGERSVRFDDSHRSLPSNSKLDQIEEDEVLLAAKSSYSSYCSQTSDGSWRPNSPLYSLLPFVPNISSKSLRPRRNSSLGSQRSLGMDGLPLEVDTVVRPVLSNRSFYDSEDEVNDFIVESFPPRKIEEPSRPNTPVLDPPSPRRIYHRVKHIPSLLPLDHEKYAWCSSTQHGNLGLRSRMNGRLLYIFPCLKKPKLVRHSYRAKFNFTGPI